MIKTGLAPRRQALQVFKQCAESVGSVIGRIAARQHIPAFSKQDDNEPHHDSNGSAIDLGAMIIEISGSKRIAVRLDEQFDRFSNTFAKDRRQFRLAAATGKN